MEVITPGRTAITRRSLVTVVGGVALSATLVAPGTVLPGYARAGATVILGFAILVAIRVATSAVLSAVRRDPPARSDEALPTVSIVVTVYNEADVLPDTLEACKSLDYPADALEIVVGYETASTDRTAAVAQSAASADPRIEAVERDAPPGGKAAATNHALARATGEVIVILDADQRPEPHAVRRAVRWFSDDDVCCVKGRCFGTNPGDSPIALCATVERGFVERAEFFARDLLDGFVFFTGGQAFFRADALESVGEFDESILLEDVDMAYRLQDAGGEIRIDPGVVTYETNPASLVSWWNQRKRWARGGMQVARRHLGANVLSGPPPLRARLDFAGTLGGLLAVPLLAAASPLAALAWWDGGLALPDWAAAGVAAVAGVSLAAPYLVFAVDARDGRSHAAVEYVGPLLLWPYFALQTTAIGAAFLAEFVFRRPAVYVTSASAEQ